MLTVVQAMGIDGVGFARIPGAPDDYNRVPVDGSPSWAEILRNSSVTSIFTVLVCHFVRWKDRWRCGLLVDSWR